MAAIVLAIVVPAVVSAKPQVTFETEIKLKQRSSSFIECANLVAEQLEPAKALEACNSAAEEDPTRGDTYYYRGFSYFYLDRYIEAEADFSRAIELGAQNLAESYFQRAVCKERQRRLRDAAADFKIAYEQKPQWSSARRKVEEYQWAYE
jgi:tetratricopeptide (TPR) repeat protein